MRTDFSSSSVKQICRSILIAFIALLSIAPIIAQRRSASGLTLFGDVKMKAKDGTTPEESVTIVLYTTAGEVGRQIISNRGRYRFANLEAGEYEIAIEVQGNEIGRLRNITVGGLSNSPYGFQQDLDFELKSPGTKTITGIVSADEVYVRNHANESLFQKAQSAAEKKKYDQASTLLRQIVDNDKADFQAWTILGTVYLLQEKPADAETAYLTAIQVKPNFGLALLNLGKLRSSQKKYQEAIDPLTHAVESHPESAEANLLLGEAYLQIRKGSKAIPYLNEAARLGRPEAHLRLGWLYNAAGMKDKAAVEYEEFLKKNPAYPEHKKLEEYISANKR